MYHSLFTLSPMYVCKTEFVLEAIKLPTEQGYGVVRTSIWVISYFGLGSFATKIVSLGDKRHR